MELEADCSGITEILEKREFVFFFLAIWQGFSPQSKIDVDGSGWRTFSKVGVDIFPTKFSYTVFLRTSLFIFHYFNFKYIHVLFV